MDTVKWAQYSLVFTKMSAMKQSLHSKFWHQVADFAVPHNLNPDARLTGYESYGMSVLVKLRQSYL